MSVKFAKEMRVKITFTEEGLGTQPNNQEIYSEFIASKSPDATTVEDEILAIGKEEFEEKQMTVFPRNDNNIPFIYDYQWKGFLKEAGRMMNRIPSSETKKTLKAFLQVINGNIFIKADVPDDIKSATERRKVSRQTLLNIPDGAQMNKCQRPLRAQTAQGERVSLACSETIPAGTTCEFTICLMDAKLEKVVAEWLDYGEEHGTLQWRNSGKGTFVWDLLDENGKVIGGNNEFAE